MFVAIPAPRVKAAKRLFDKVNGAYKPVCSRMMRGLEDESLSKFICMLGKTTNLHGYSLTYFSQAENDWIWELHTYDSDEAQTLVQDLALGSNRYIS